jgi:hypothetical protein
VRGVYNKNRIKVDNYMFLAYFAIMSHNCYCNLTDCIFALYAIYTDDDHYSDIILHITYIQVLSCRRRKNFCEK